MASRSRALIAAGIVVLLIVVGVGAFMTGRSAGLNDAQNIRTEFVQSRFGTQSGQGVPGGDPTQTGQQARGSAAGRQVASGTIKSVQGNIVQVTQRDGSTTSVTIDDKMSVTKTVTGTVADIQPGWNITVFEQASSGGTTRRVVLTQEQGQGQRPAQGQGQ